MNDLNLVEQIRQRLAPQLQTLVTTLTERGELSSAAFFGSLLQRLAVARSEEDLLEFTFELSSCAFVGLDYSPLSAQDVDAFLASAEQIAHAMTADDGDAH